MHHVSSGLMAGAAAAILAAASAGAANTPVFRADIDLVNVAVTITDGRSHYITDLAEGDFQVLEDGRAQELTLFTHQRLPLSLSILMDTSQSMNRKLPEAQAAAVRFVRTLQGGDEAQVVQFNDKARIIADFTGDQARLESAIEGTHASGSTALYNAVYIALKDLAARRRTDELRRTAIVVLSDGEDTASLISDDQVVDLARRTGITIYGISLRPAEESDVANLDDTGLPRYFFRTLTEQTGGQAHFLQKIAQLPGVYDHVAQELRSQYSLGYFSSNAARDGRWRNIQVRVPGHPQLQVRHRTGYFAPRR
jgi:Ca-activated chloride channel family protein